MDQKPKLKRHNMPFARFFSAVVTVSMVLSLMPSQGLEWVQRHAAQARSQAVSQNEAAAAAAEQAAAQAEGGMPANEAAPSQQQEEESQPAEQERTEVRLALHLENAVLLYGGDVDAAEVVVPTDGDMEFGVRAKDGFRVARVLYDETELGAREDGTYVVGKDQLRDGATLSIIAEAVAEPEKPAGDEQKPEEQKPEEQAADEQKPEEQKPEEQKPEEQKPGEQKPEEQKPGEQKPEEQKAEEQKPGEQKPEEQKPGEQKPEEQKPEEQKDDEQAVNTEVEERNDQSTFTYEDGAIRVTASLDDPTVLPKGVRLVVTPITARTPAYNYDAYMDALNAGAGKEAEFDDQNTLLYDIAFLVNDAEGKLIEVQPAEGTVHVSFDFKARQLSDGLGAQDSAEVTVAHLPLAEGIVDEAGTTSRATDIAAGDVTVEAVGADVNGDSVTMTVNDFSVYAFSYTVDFTYNGYTFSIAGETDILLSELFQILGIDANVADVADVEFTNESLVKVEKAGDDWKLISIAPFQTNETLTVTLKNGDKFVIDVTDEAEVQHLQDITSLLTSATIKAPFDEATQTYLVKPDTVYEMTLDFAETDALQFDNGGHLFYKMPEGLQSVAEFTNGSFDIVATDSQGNEFTIPNNTFAINKHDDDKDYIDITLNSGHEKYNVFTASGYAFIKLSFKSTINDDITKILYKDGYEVKVDTSGDAKVRPTKEGQYDPTTDRVKYRIKLESYGSIDAAQVQITDTITGTALSYVEGSARSGSNADGSDAKPIDVTTTTNGFTVTIPSIPTGTAVYLFYEAAIDRTQLTGKGEVGQTENTVSVKPTNGPDEPETSSEDLTNEINYPWSTSKKSEGVTGEGNTKYVKWHITANDERNISLAGRTITDTIGTESRSRMHYSGDGIYIVKTDKAGNHNDEPILVPWDQLTLIPSTASSIEQAYGWSYTVNSAETTPYKYDITYETEVDVSGNITDMTVHNEATGPDGESHEGTGTVGPGDGKVTYEKKVSEAESTAEITTWYINITVPKEGLQSATVFDEYPHGTVGNKTYYDTLDSVDVVSGLLPGETFEWVQNQEGTGVTIKFYKDASKSQEGLLPTTNNKSRKISIKVTTKINREWANAAPNAEHKNTARLKADDVDFKPEDASIKPASQSIKKDSDGQVGTVEIDGVTYPVYKYTVELQGVGSGTVVIKDTYDARLTPLDPAQYTIAFDDDDVATWLNELYTKVPNAADPENPTPTRIVDDTHTQSVTPVTDESNNTTTYTITGDFTHSVYDGLLSKYIDKYYDTYYFSYLMTIKPSALHDLNQDTIATATNELGLNNSATWNGKTSDVTMNYSYNAVDKDIIEKEVDSNKVIWAKYRVTLNINAEDIAPDADTYDLTDRFENQYIDYQSITVTPGATTFDPPITWDTSGNTLVFKNIPDKRTIVIEYKARVPRGQESDSTVEIKNTAEVSEKFKDDTDETIDNGSDGSAGAKNFQITILKHEAGQMNKTLEGAVFGLYDENKNPITPAGKPNEPVTVTTNDKGLALVYGSESEHGWYLRKEKIYYLKEQVAPDGYMLDPTWYQFQIDDTGQKTLYTDPDWWYPNNDTMRVKNYPITSVEVKKDWADNTSNHTSDKVTVKLQQKIGNNGQWSDDIYMRVDNDAGGYEWKNVSFVATLDQSNEWKAVFSDKLPLVVPYNGADTEVTYRVVETKVNDLAVVPPTSDSDVFGQTYYGGVVNIVKKSDNSYSYTITNTPKLGALKLKKLVTVNGNAINKIAPDNDDRKLADGWYTFVVSGQAPKSANDWETEDKGIREVKIKIENGSAASALVKDLLVQGAEYVPVDLDDGYVVLNGLPEGDYLITETASTNNNTSPVQASYKVTVVANAAPEAVPTASFTNNYPYGSLKISKIITGNNPYGDGKYTFTVKSEKTPVIEKTVDIEVRNGKATPETPVEVDHLPAGKYYVYESASNNTHVELKAITPEAVVKTDDDSGTITGKPKSQYAELTVVEGKFGDDAEVAMATFENEYEASGSAVFSATKKADASLGNRTFTFLLLDADNNDAELQRITDVKAGETKQFTAIKYSAEGTHKYKIKELIPAGATEANNYTYEGVHYDPTVHEVTVTVTDPGTGTLDVKYDNKTEFETPVFENSYTTEGTGEIKVQKSVGDNTWPKDEQGKPLVAKFKLEALSATVAGQAIDKPDIPMPEADKQMVELTKPNTDATFGSITYTKAGEYKYTITETETNWPGWSANNTITATVTAVDNGNGTITATTTYSPTNDVITNVYSTEPTSAQIKVQKKIANGVWPKDEEGQPIPAEFKLTRVSPSDAPMPTNENGDTVVLRKANTDGFFGDIKYTAKGTYKYKITETSTWGERWAATPENGIGVTVTVTDDEQGHLNKTVTYDGEVTAITNTYTPDEPDFEKKIQDINDSTAEVSEWQDSADYDIGDAVPYMLHATLADDVSSYKKYSITFTDQMEKSLDFDANSVEVYLGTTKLTKRDYELTKINEHRFTLKLSWQGNSLGEGKIGRIGDGPLAKTLDGADVIVYFDATLNNDACIGKLGNVNTAKLTYSNKPDSTDDKDTADTPWDDVIAFTYEVDVNKVDKDHKGLEGAKFQLYKLYHKDVTSPEGAERDADGYVAVGAEQSGTKPEGADKANFFSWKGLDDGTYKIVETVVPEGMLPVEDKVFTVEAGHVVAWEDAKTPTWNDSLTDGFLANANGRDVILKTITTGDVETGKIKFDGNIQTTDNDIVNTDKDEPTFKKKIADANDSYADEVLPADITTIAPEKWQDSADYDINDPVPFKLSAKLPRDVSEYKKYSISFEDKMEDSLTFDYSKGVDAVYITPKGGTRRAIAAGDYVLNGGSHGFTLSTGWGVGYSERMPISEDLNEATIDVYFKATLNTSAKLGQDGNVNGARLHYSNNPRDASQSAKTPWDYVIAFTYEIDVNKVDKDTAEALEGAQFELVKVNENGEAIAEPISVDASKADPKDENSKANVFAFTGLDDGIYKLTETKAPKGHKLMDPITFEVTATHAGTWGVDSLNPKWKGDPASDADGRETILTTLTGGSKEEGLLTLANLVKAEKLAGLVGDVKDEKVQEPTFEKKIKDVNDSTGEVTKDTEKTEDQEWIDSADYDLGDPVPFRLKATLPTDIDKYTGGYHVTFDDKMEEGLTFIPGSVKVVVDGDELDTSKYDIDYSVNEGQKDTFSLTIRWGNQDRSKWELAQDASFNVDDTHQLADLKGKKVEVFFDATLNEHASVGQLGNVNAAMLTYSSNVNEDGNKDEHEKKIPWDFVIAFTYKVDVSKVDKDTEEALAGAEFKLEKFYKGETEDKDEWREVDTIENAEGNLFEFKGLDDGKYKLTETKVPADYKPIDPIEFEVTAQHEVVWDYTNLLYNTEPASPARTSILTSLTGDKATGTLVFASADLPNGKLPGTITNQGLGALKIQKHVKHANPEDEVTVADGTYYFTITDSEGKKVTKDQLGNAIEPQITITNGESGEFVAHNLLPGTYTVTEDTDKNPKGILLLAENGVTVTVAIRNDYTDQLEQSDEVIPEVATAAFTNSKPDVPEFEKKIKDANDSTGETSDWQDSADYDIGDAVPYKLTATLPEDFGDYPHYHLTFTDKMEESLDFDEESVEVHVGGAEEALAKDNYTLTPGEDGHSFELTVAWGQTKTQAEPEANAIDAALNGKDVEVFFTATLNESAKLGQPGNVNAAKLTYSTNPSVDGEDKDTEEKPWDYVIAFTYSLDVSKVDPKGEALNGVTFKLEKLIKATEEGAEDTWAEIRTFENADSNLFEFKGIDDGIYRLTETAAPYGYQAIDPVTFTVEAGHVTTWDALTKDYAIPASRYEVLESLKATQDSAAVVADFQFMAANDAEAGYAASGKIPGTATDQELADLLIQKVYDKTVTAANAKDVEWPFVVGLTGIDSEEETITLQGTKTTASGEEDVTLTFVHVAEYDAPGEYWYYDATRAGTTFENAVALKAGESILIRQLAVGTGYIVRELPGVNPDGTPAEGIGLVRTEQDGVDVTGTNESGNVIQTIQGTVGKNVDGIRSEVRFTNGSTHQISIRKTNTGLPEDPEKRQALLDSYSFTVTGPNGFSQTRKLADFDVEEATGDLVWTITDIEPGDYTVSESRTGGSLGQGDTASEVDFGGSGSETDEGSGARIFKVDGEQPVVVPVTNRYFSVTRAADVAVTKQLVGDDYAGEGAFTFKLAKASGSTNDGDILPVTNTVTVTKNEDGSWPVVAFDSIGFQVHEGTYYYTISEVDAKEPGMTYADPVWVRIDNTIDSLDSVIHYGTEAEVKAGQGTEFVPDSGIALTNTFTAGKAELRVAKAFSEEGAEYDGDEEFEFTLAAVDAEGNAKDDAPMPANTTARAKAGETASFGSASYAKTGTWYYTITEAQGTTPGVTYATEPVWARVDVTDGAKHELNATVTYGTQEEVVAGEATADVATITNSYEKVGTFTVHKVLEGAEDEDLAKEFGFRATLYTDAGCTQVLDTGNEATAYGDLTFVNGVAEFTLQPDGTATATDIPLDQDLWVSVEETDAQGMVSSFDQSVAKLAERENMTFTCTNTPSTPGTYEFSVRKAVVSNREGDKDYDYKFKVTLYDSAEKTNVLDLSGTYGDMEFENGVANITLKDGETAKADGFEQLIWYGVEETDSNGLLSTQSTAGAVTTVTNTDVGYFFKVQKTVSSTRDEDKERDYKFKVTLFTTEEKDEVLKISGTYGDMEFVDGVAEFTLGHGESASATDLPSAVYYTVEETDAGGLASTQTNNKQTGTTTVTNTYKAPTPGTKSSTIGTSTTARTSTPKTGDPTNVAVIAGIAIIGIAAVAIGIVRRRRQQ